MGREKLTLLFRLLSERSSCSSWTFDSRLPARELAGGGILFLSMLAALPAPRPDGVGEMTRWGGSKLEERWCCFGTDFGTAGTGGALLAEEVKLFDLPGDGDLNVRSVIDPPLSRRCRAPRPGTPPLPFVTIEPLPVEDTDPRLTIRFVWRLPTGSGVVVMDRRAAAAAAEDNEPLEGGLPIKA